MEKASCGEGGVRYGERKSSKCLLSRVSWPCAAAAEYRNHVWSHDFVHCRTDDGKVFRTLNILDAFSRECLAIRVRRKLNSTDVIDALTDLFILRGPPACIRSDNGPEFVAKDVRDWIAAVGARTA